MHNSDQRQESKKQKNASSSRSSEEPIDPCPICLSPAIRESSLNKCSHKFCFDCIVKWAKVVSRRKSRKLTSLKCPLCKTKSCSVVRGLNGDSSQPSSFAIRSVLMMQKRDGRYQQCNEGLLKELKKELRVYLARERKHWENFKASDEAVFQYLQTQTTKPIPEFPVFPDDVLVPPIHKDTVVRGLTRLASQKQVVEEVKQELRAFQAQQRKYQEHIKSWDETLFQFLRIVATEPIPEFPVFPDDILVPPIYEEAESSTVAAFEQARKEHRVFQAQLLKYRDYIDARNEALLPSFQKLEANPIAEANEAEEERLMPSVRRSTRTRNPVNRFA